MKPRYTYLCRSFVEYLDLPLYPVLMPRNTGLGAALAAYAAHDRTIRDAVDFEGRCYIRSHDGLTYELSPWSPCER